MDHRTAGGREGEHTHGGTAGAAARKGDARRHRGGGTSRALQAARHKSATKLHPPSLPPIFNPASRSITQRGVIFLATWRAGGFRFDARFARG